MSAPQQQSFGLLDDLFGANGELSRRGAGDRVIDDREAVPGRAAGLRHQLGAIDEGVRDHCDARRRPALEADGIVQTAR